MRRETITWMALALVLGSAPLALALPDISPEISTSRSTSTPRSIPVTSTRAALGPKPAACSSTSRRRAHSLGPDDLYLGDPGCPNCSLNPGAPCANPYYVCSTAHGHPHFESFAKAELLDSNGDIVMTGRKQGFCLEDFDCANPQYDCGNQGITVGCSRRVRRRIALPIRRHHRRQSARRGLHPARDAGSRERHRGGERKQ